MNQILRQETAAGYDAVADAWHASRQGGWGEFAFLVELLQKIPPNPPLPQGGSEARNAGRAGGLRILDAGCGNGRLVTFLKSVGTPPHLASPSRGEELWCSYLGVDSSAGLLAKAREQHPTHVFQQVDLVDLRLDRQFDLVTCVAVLHHLPRADQLTVLRHLRTHLAPGGHLFLTVWNLWQPRYLRYVVQSYVRAFADLVDPRLRGDDKRKARDCRVPFQHTWQRQVWAFTVGDLLDLLEEAGFTDIDVYGTAGDKKAGIFSARNITAVAQA